MSDFSAVTELMGSKKQSQRIHGSQWSSGGTPGYVVREPRFKPPPSGSDIHQNSHC